MATPAGQVIVVIFPAGISTVTGYGVTAAAAEENIRAQLNRIADFIRGALSIKTGNAIIAIFVISKYHIISCAPPDRVSVADSL
jgi:hypothetical protein